MYGQILRNSLGNSSGNTPKISAKYKFYFIKKLSIIIIVTTFKFEPFLHEHDYLSFPEFPVFQQ